MPKPNLEYDTHFGIFNVKSTKLNKMDGISPYMMAINVNIHGYVCNDGEYYIRAIINGTLSETPTRDCGFDINMGGKIIRHLIRKGVQIGIVPYDPLNSQVCDEIRELKSRADSDRLFSSVLGGGEHALSILTNPDDSQIILDEYAPHNENATNTVSTSTGWSIAPGLEVGKGGKVGVSGSYDENKTSMKTYKDVEVRNLTNGNFAHWRYEVTGGDEEKDAFVPDVDTVWLLNKEIARPCKINFLVIVGDELYLDETHCSVGVEEIELDIPKC